MAKRWALLLRPRQLDHQALLIPLLLVRHALAGSSLPKTRFVTHRRGSNSAGILSRRCCRRTRDQRSSVAKDGNIASKLALHLLAARADEIWRLARGPMKREPLLHALFAYRANCWCTGKFHKLQRVLQCLDVDFMLGFCVYRPFCCD